MNVEMIAVISAGIMGRGIAQVAVLGGFDSVLNDISVELLESARSRIEQDMQKGVDRGKLTAEGMAAGLDRLSNSTDLEESVAKADIVIEAVPEKIDLKMDIFRRIDKAAPGHAILASNTSCLSITEMAAATERPKKSHRYALLQPSS